jgi:hypothetical protein
MPTSQLDPLYLFAREVFWVTDNYAFASRQPIKSSKRAHDTFGVQCDLSINLYASVG